METCVLSKAELVAWLGSLKMSPVIVLLMGGDRLACVDEAVAVSENGQIVGVATIAPKGEDYSGQPGIVALYVLPRHRRRGIGRMLMEATVRRCLARGFAQVRVDVMSAYAMRIITSLPADLRAVLDIHDHGGIMDTF